MQSITNQFRSNIPQNKIIKPQRIIINKRNKDYYAINLVQN